MGKKRKAGRSGRGPPTDTEPDAPSGKLGPIDSYKDLSDSEEYFLDQDRILFGDDGDEPKSKRQRQLEAGRAPIEFSDEEILGVGDDDDVDDEDDADDDEAEMDGDIGGLSPSLDRKVRQRKQGKADGSSDEEEEADPSGLDKHDQGWWGTSAREYYDADKIETEIDAEQEAAEANRIQKARLSKMAEEDFVFDQDEWLAPAKDALASSKTPMVTEVLKEVVVSDDMGLEERESLLRLQYPEFDHLASEFNALHPLLESLRVRLVEGSQAGIEEVKYWVLGCYVAALASYFAIMTSPARDRDQEGENKIMVPSDLRKHEIMETLVECRKVWLNVREARVLPGQQQNEPVSVRLDARALDVAKDIDSISVPSGKAEGVKRGEKGQRKASAKQDARSIRLQEAEAAVADLVDLVPVSHRIESRKEGAMIADVGAASGQDADFGEEDIAGQGTRKKSLRFYTSQIVQKANKHAGAGRDAGGDVDIPYRERLKDRQARLNAQAERRGRRDSKHGTDLGGNDDEDNGGDRQGQGAGRTLLRGDGNGPTTDDNDDDSRYYKEVAEAAQKRKDEKVARRATAAVARPAVGELDGAEHGVDGKRKISYAIEKNKGLAPQHQRRKDVRNPRVKKRKQYEQRLKRLAGARPAPRTEPTSGYAGERSGINMRTVRGIKL